MALSAGSICDVRNGGASTNAGFFNPSNANFATDLTATSGTSSSPVVSSASYTFVSGDIGAFVFVKSGTNWTPGWYPIVSVSAGAATLDASVGAVILYTSLLIASAPNTATGVATTATPGSGVWGIDYSRSTSPRVAYTDMVIGATTTQFTSAGNPVGKNLVGNHINVQSGTGFTVQLVEVVSTSGTTATCDKSLGTAASTGGNGNLGGAFAQPGSWSQYRVDAMPICFLKYSATTYDITSSTAAISGGRITYGLQNKLIGWDTNRCVTNRDANRPTIKSTVASITMVSNVDGFSRKTTLRNIILDGNAQTANTGLACSDTVFAQYTTAKNCTTAGFNGIRDIYKCEADTCALGYTSPSSSYNYAFSVARRCTSHGFNMGALGTIDHCIANGNGGLGFNGGGFTIRCTHCTAYGNTSHGFGNTADDRGTTYYRCVSYGNGGWGFAGSSAIGNTWIIQCAGGNNTSGNIQDASPYIEDFVTLTADPFTSASGNDFSLNSTAGGGAALRGISMAYPGISTTTYADIGAAQHQDAGGGGMPMIGSRIGGVLL